MTTLDAIFLYSAIGGGAVLVLQLLMMFMGMDDGGFGEAGDAGGFEASDLDADATTDTSGFWLLEMLSLRTLAAAATFFGLVGKAMLASGQSAGVSIAASCVAGYAAMYSVYWAFKQIFKLETSGNTDIRGAVGLPAQVYVPIGPGDAAGKVQMKLQGRTVEYQAFSDATERLATGQRVVVTEVVSSDTVRVQPTGEPQA